MKRREKEWKGQRDGKLPLQKNDGEKERKGKRMKPSLPWQEGRDW